MLRGRTGLPVVPRAAGVAPGTEGRCRQGGVAGRCRPRQATPGDTRPDRPPSRRGRRLLAACPPFRASYASSSRMPNHPPIYKRRFSLRKSFPLSGSTAKPHSVSVPGTGTGTRRRARRGSPCWGGEGPDLGGPADGTEGRPSLGDTSQATTAPTPALTPRPSSPRRPKATTGQAASPCRAFAISLHLQHQHHTARG